MKPAGARRLTPGRGGNTLTNTDASPTTAGRNTSGPSRPSAAKSTSPTRAKMIAHDRDRVYGAAVTRRLRAMGIRDKPIPPGSPWQNGFVEILIGSIGQVVSGSKSKARDFPRVASPLAFAQ
jgi:hypothetical protein